ncbi:hypothetical protein DPMN_099879 [Dreissena polymorpha]|uniref:Uncharacterized protein n=1 Tax=Dreissena polymorpha TaxID=45954 RepID=A0A9D4LEX0_DREPO|nr:hypothetical protein DPMN_099879 [Dreissena polymorpha]
MSLRIPTTKTQHKLLLHSVIRPVPEASRVGLNKCKMCIDFADQALNQLLKKSSHSASASRSGSQRVGDILKKKSVYQEQWEKNASGSKFRFDNECKFDRLNELTWEWFRWKRAQNFPFLDLRSSVLSRRE